MHFTKMLLALLGVSAVASAIAIEREPVALEDRAVKKKTKTHTKTKTTKTKTTSTATPTLPADYIPNLLKQHNLHRANHSASDVVWNATLASIATQIAQSCTFAHQSIDGGGYGQNIAAGVPANNVAAVVTNLWYDSEFNSFLPSYYGQKNPPNFSAWGHFSQVVWKATSEIGCGTVYCSKGLGNVGSGVQPWFTVCNYRGPGNVGNLYGQNIGKPLGHPNVVIKNSGY